MRLQKAQAIQMATSNPVYIQSGVVSPIEMANGLKRFYQELDVPNWEELIVPAQQIQQNMQRAMQTPPPDDIKFKAEDLTDAEQAQLLARKGIKPDIPGRALEAKDEEDAEKVEGYLKVMDTVGKQTAKEDTGAGKKPK
jgi:hypothetical protein